jgi:hypothetical protein
VNLVSKSSIYFLNTILISLVLKMDRKTARVTRRQLAPETVWRIPMMRFRQLIWTRNLTAMRQEVQTRRLTVLTLMTSSV